MTKLLCHLLRISLSFVRSKKSTNLQAHHLRCSKCRFQINLPKIPNNKIPNKININNRSSRNNQNAYHCNKNNRHISSEMSTNRSYHQPIATDQNSIQNKGD